MPRPEWILDVSSDSESTESSYDSDQSQFYDEDDIELILDCEEFNQSDNMQMVDKKYYIGCYIYQPEYNILLFVRKIHLNTFYQFSSSMISEYFYWYSMILLGKKPKVEIMQLVKLPDDTYSAVIKTFWIKIIQRTWKKTYRELQQYISYRKKQSTLRNSEFGVRIRHSPPGLRGLLANY